MTMVKFCGLSRPEDIAVANELLPDMVGFVFARASRRAVTGEVAKKLGRALAPSIRRVGVFMEVKMPEIAEMVKRGVIDTVQLHALLKSVKRRFQSFVVRRKGQSSKSSVPLA